MVWLAGSVVFLHNVCVLASQVVLEASAAGATNNNDKHGAVASESKVCSQIGIELMNAGGNAADAVVWFELLE